MRNLFIVMGAFTVVVAVLVGEYTAYWHNQTQAIRRSVEISVQRMNDYGKTLDPNITLVRYQSIDVSGYPFADVVIIHNAQLMLPITTIVRRLRTVQQTRAAQKAPAWNETIETGNIEVTQHIGSDDALLRFASPITYQSTVDGRVRYAEEVTSSGLTCHVKDLKNSIDEIAADSSVSSATPLHWLGADADVRCADTAIRARDQRSGSLLREADEISLAFSNAASSGLNRSLKLQASQKNDRRLPAGDRMFADQMADVLRDLELPQAATSRMIPPSRYGISNNRVDIAYDGPVTPAAFQNGDLHAHLDILHLDRMNDLMNSSLSLHAATDTGQSGSNDSLKLHDRITVSKRYDSVARAALHDRLVRAITPHLSPLGTVTIDIDASGSVASAFENHFSGYSLSLNRFAIDTDPYGLNVQGDLSRADQQTSADVTIRCRRCDRLVTDTGRYLIRAQHAYLKELAAKIALPRPRYIGLTDQHISVARRFMHKIAYVSKTSNGPTMVFHIVVSPHELPRINNRTLLQILVGRL